MKGPYLDTKEFCEGIKRVGVGSDNKYRSSFDLMLSSLPNKS